MLHAHRARVTGAHVVEPDGGQVERPVVPWIEHERQLVPVRCTDDVFPHRATRLWSSHHGCVDPRVTGPRYDIRAACVGAGGRGDMAFALFCRRRRRLDVGSRLARLQRADPTRPPIDAHHETLPSRIGSHARCACLSKPLPRPRLHHSLELASVDGHCHDERRVDHTNGRGHVRRRRVRERPLLRCSRLSGCLLGAGGDFTYRVRHLDRLLDRHLRGTHLFARRLRRLGRLVRLHCSHVEPTAALGRAGTQLGAHLGRLGDSSCELTRLGLGHIALVPCSDRLLLVRRCLLLGNLGRGSPLLRTLDGRHLLLLGRRRHPLCKIRLCESVGRVGLGLSDALNEGYDRQAERLRRVLQPRELAADRIRCLANLGMCRWARPPTALAAALAPALAPPSTIASLIVIVALVVTTLDHTLGRALDATAALCLVRDRAVGRWDHRHQADELLQHAVTYARVCKHRLDGIGRRHVPGQDCMAQSIKCQPMLDARVSKKWPGRLRLCQRGMGLRKRHGWRCRRVRGTDAATSGELAVE